MRALRHHVGDFTHCVWQNLALDGEVVVLVAGGLERRCSTSRWRPSHDWVNRCKGWSGGRPCLVVVKQVDVLLRAVGGCGLNQWRVGIKWIGPELILLPDTIESAVVEETISSANGHLAVALWIPSQTKSRTPVVVRVGIDPATIWRTSCCRVNRLCCGTGGAGGENHAVGIGRRVGRRPWNHVS